MVAATITKEEVDVLRNTLRSLTEEDIWEIVDAWCSHAKSDEVNQVRAEVADMIRKCKIFLEAFEREKGAYKARIAEMVRLPRGIDKAKLAQLDRVTTAILEILWLHGEQTPSNIVKLVNKEGYNLGKLEVLQQSYTKKILAQMLKNGLVVKVSRGIYRACVSMPSQEIVLYGVTRRT